VEPIDRFGEILSQPSLALDEVMVEIAAVLRPGIDRIGELARLDELAATCATPTVDGVIRHLFHGSESFTGDTATYPAIENSLIDRVLDRRRGIPITLSILAIEVGRRIGVELVGVGMPTHFLTAEPDPATGRPRRFFDVFSGGTELDEAGCEALYRRMTRRDDRFDLRWLRPTSPRFIVIRVLNNLKGALARAGDPVAFHRLMQMRSLLPELGPHETLDRIRAEAPFN